jgi:alkylation response protein AidB-like acyl-CoA dehydrogenase
MDFEIPDELVRYLAELDDFIEREIRPLEEQDDNIRFFDHRREDARTDWDRDGLPSEEWEALLAEARRRADAAGHYRYAFPKPGWRSSASTSRRAGSACTTTSRTSTPSWATTWGCS